MKVAVFALFSMLLMVPTSAKGHDTNADHTLEISDVWARKTRRTTSAAVYLKVHNGTETVESITDVSSPIANMATLHLSQEVDGVMRMDMQDSVPVPVGATVAFEPGGLHIMLMGLSKPLAEGDVFPVTLSFEQAGDITVYVDVTGLSGPQTK